jgi:hypothetical protein
VSRHVAPHLWADAFAGRLDSDTRAELDRHADECPRCARARATVRRASDTFPSIRTQPAPELGWDSVRARVHWSVSTAKHSRVSMRRFPRIPKLGIALGAAALVAGGVTVYLAASHHGASAPTLAHATPPPVVKHPAALTALVSRLAGDVMIDGIRPTSATTAFEHPLVAGTVLATGNGRIDVQFGEASGFALGPRSTLEVKKLDAETIELAVEGVVDVEVAPRAKGQRFFIVAGDQTVEVRGTRFSVTHDPHGTRVACQHGLVAVTDAHHPGTVEVGAARRAFVAVDQTLADVHAAPLTVDELGQLAKATPWTTPGWNPDLAIHSAPLEITTPGKRDVRVDGIELGEAPLQMRVMPGRHTIETADAAGRFRRAGWVDVNAARAARFEALPVVDEPVVTPSSSILRRMKQFSAGIDHERLRACTRRLAKSGLTDTVQIEISVDAFGAVNVLNVIDTDLPADTATCVHDVLSDVRFSAGPAATWRDKIAL